MVAIVRSSPGIIFSVRQISSRETDLDQVTSDVLDTSN